MRSISMNAALLRATARLAPPGIQVELFDGLGRLPLLNPELETSMPATVRDLHTQVAASDALLIASPEGNRRREILTTMSADLVADASLALPLRGMGLDEQGILDSGHAADIHRALAQLASGAPRK
jgi:NADPH-dependent FMN reductase